MDPFRLQFVREPLSRADLAAVAAQGFGDMVKAIVDVERGVMAVGAELHSDEEAALLDDGSRQPDLWASTSILLTPATGGSSSIP